MKNISGIASVAIILTAGLLSACTSLFPENQQNSSFTRNAYATIGAGLSTLDPDDSLSASNVSDGNSQGGQLAAGIDLNRQFSVELHAADLGSAGFSPGGEISYQLYGASGLVYAGKNRSRFKRQGLTGYGRLGLSVMNNGATAGVSYRNDNQTSLLVGAGVEFAGGNGLGVRGEVVSFDEDALLTQVGIIYRFGNTSKPATAPIVAAINPAAVIAPPVPAMAIVKPDDDADGVINPTDECKDTIPNAIVDKVGCILFGGVIEGVNFHSNSEQLTQQARMTLNRVADTLVEYDTVAVTLSAHTDSQGDATYNMALSERRVNSVVKFLSQHGVNISRVKSLAFGETQPIASNETVDGRTQNRRVEIFADKSMIRVPR